MMLSMSVMKEITVLFLIQLSLTVAEFSSQRQGCVRTGKFDTHIKGMIFVVKIVFFLCINKQHRMSHVFPLSTFLQSITIIKK